MKNPETPAILKNLKNGLMFRSGGASYLKLVVRGDEYPEVYIFEALRIWKGLLKKSAPAISLASLSREVTQGVVVITATVSCGKKGKDAVGALERAYCLFWEALLETKISSPLDSCIIREKSLAIAKEEAELRRLMAPPPQQADLRGAKFPDNVL